MERPARAGHSPAVGLAAAGASGASDPAADSARRQIPAVDYFGGIERRLPYPVQAAALAQRGVQDVVQAATQKLHLAPVLPPAPGAPVAILDAGCGYGYWASAMATKFPSGSIVGLDRQLATEALSAFAQASEAAARVTYLEADLLAPGPQVWERDRYALAYARDLNWDLGEKRWPEFVRRLVASVRPGGWVELVEFGPARIGAGGPRIDPPALAAVNEWVTRVGPALGFVNAYIGDLLEHYLREAGCLRVVARTFEIPVGGAGNPVGGKMRGLLFERLRRLGPLLADRQKTAPAPPVDPATFERALQQLKNDCADPDLHVVVALTAAIGQRPL